MKALYCIAPDGAFKIEGEFPSTQSAWDRASDMGSRWFFYPINVVATSKNPLARISDVPHGMAKEWIGKTVRTLCRALSANADHACDYANGRCPLMVYPKS